MRFLVSYARGTNLMGLNGAISADAYANLPVTASYQPAVQFDSRRHARVTILNLAQGVYKVLFNGSSGTNNGGDVQVTADSPLDVHCRVAFWSFSPASAEVVCSDNGGQFVDSAFTIQWATA